MTWQINGIEVRTDLPRDEAVSDLIEKLVTKGMPIGVAAPFAEQVMNMIGPHLAANSLIEQLNGVIEEAAKLNDSSRVALRLHRWMAFTAILFAGFNLLILIGELAHLPWFR